MFPEDLLRPINIIDFKFTKDSCVVIKRTEMNCGMNPLTDKVHNTSWHYVSQVSPTTPPNPPFRVQHLHHLHHHMFQRAIHRSLSSSSITLGTTRHLIRLRTASPSTIRQIRAMSEIKKISTPLAAQREFIEKSDQPSSH